MCNKFLFEDVRPLSNEVPSFERLKEGDASSYHGLEFSSLQKDNKQHVQSPLFIAAAVSIDPFNRNGLNTWIGICGKREK